MILTTYNPHAGKEPGEVVFYHMAFFLQLGHPPSFPLSVHESYKENNQ